MTEAVYRDFYAAVDHVRAEMNRRARKLRQGTWSDAEVASGYEGAATMLARILVDFAPERMRGGLA